MSSNRRNKFSKSRQKSKAYDNNKRDHYMKNINDNWESIISKIKHNINNGNDDIKSFNINLQQLSCASLNYEKIEMKQLEEDLLMLGGALSMVGLTSTATVMTTTAKATATNNASQDSNTIENVEELQVSFCCVLCHCLGSNISGHEVSLSVNAFRDLSRLMILWAETEVKLKRVSNLSNKAIAALGSLLNTTQQNGVQIKRYTLSLILTYMKEFGPMTKNENQEIGDVTVLAIVQATLETLQNLFPSKQKATTSQQNTGEIFTIESITEIFEAVMELLKRHSGDGKNPHEDLNASRMYHALLKALHILILQGDTCYKNHMPHIIECISKFFQYGIQKDTRHSNTIGTLENKTWITNKYVQSNYKNTYIQDSCSTTSVSGSEFNETSDSDSSCNSISQGGNVNGGDRYRSLRVRLAALSIIQSMALIDRKKLHKYWLQLLPCGQPLQRTPITPHLVTVMLYDSHPQVRALSANTISVLLDGQAQKVFLSLAELQNEALYQVRGFTTLSASLGRMVYYLHDGLIYGIQNEAKSCVLSTLFRTMTSLITAVQYNRMPSDLIPKVIHVIRQRWHKLHGANDIDAHCESAALAALRAAFSSTPVNNDILSYLNKTSTSGISSLTFLSRNTRLFLEKSFDNVDNIKASNFKCSLMDELFMISITEKPLLRSEALSVLSGIVLNYGSLFNDKWINIEKILRENIIFGELESTSAQEKLVQQAVRFLGSLLSTSVDVFDTQFKTNLNQSVSLYLIPCLQHYNSVVRMTALRSAGSISEAIMKVIDDDILHQMLYISVNSTINETIPAIQSAACRAIGALVNANRILDDKNLFGMMSNFLRKCLDCQTISVRIAASWSLANLSDAIAKAENNNLRDSEGELNDSYTQLALAAITASKDHEKVKANGVRALGHLLGIYNFNTSSINNIHEINEKMWLSSAVACLNDGLSSGGTKVKWNACYAVGNMASNASFKSNIFSENYLKPLITLLIGLVKDSPNFKVQTHAAGALAAFSDRIFYTDNLIPILSVLINRLSNLENGSNTTEACTSDSEFCINDDTDQKTLDSSNDVLIPNYKYHEGLKHQLETSILHILGFLDKNDIKFITESQINFIQKLLLYKAENMNTDANSTMEKIMLMLKN